MDSFNIHNKFFILQWLILMLINFMHIRKEHKRIVPFSNLLNQFICNNLCIITLKVLKEQTWKIKFQECSYLARL